LISLKTVEDVLISYIAAYSSGTCLSVQNNSETIPNYSISNHHSSFCLLATRERQIGMICRDFYQSLGEGSAKSLCPFGFEVIYTKIKIGQKHILLYGILSFNGNIFQQRISPLPRVTKKRAKTEIEKNKQLFDLDATYIFYSSASDVLNTLLAGRVGASIRSLSHHILTPIQGAMADLDNIVIDNKYKEQFESLHRNISQINDTSKTIQLLLAEQLQFNKNQIRRVNIHQYIDKVLLSLKSAAVKNRIIFTQDYNNVSKTIEAIPDQFHIVIQNLIQNAFKYSYSGFQDKDTIIHISFNEYNNNCIEIKISNIGCGLTEREIDSLEVFDLGFRGELSRDRERTGSGCGLYISNLIATAHKGKILIKSYPVGKVGKNGQVYKTNVSLVMPIIQE
jgi:signal transduction histidine kinase